MCRMTLEELKTTQEYIDLLTLVKDRHFMIEGSRNDDAVNAAILFHVLGIDDYEQQDDFLGDNCFDKKAIDWDYWIEKREILESYLPSWGPEDDRSKALNYMIK